MIWAQLPYLRRPRAGPIALISGHALHFVVRLVLEKMPGRLPCPLIMRLGTFRSEEEQGLPIDGSPQKLMGERTANRGLLCSLRCPAQRLGVPPPPGVQKASSISAAQLTAPCPYPFDLPASRVARLD